MMSSVRNWEWTPRSFLSRQGLDGGLRGGVQADLQRGAVLDQPGDELPDAGGGFRRGARLRRTGAPRRVRRRCRHR
ncbi:MAG: hypothetical protein MZV70_35515 [Desulfobacterales bacterium]|nr:hypothetical protein [Desulfobacterales bacterium]